MQDSSWLRGCASPTRADNVLADRRWVQHQLEENLRAIQNTLDRHHKALRELIEEHSSRPMPDGAVFGVGSLPVGPLASVGGERNGTATVETTPTNAGSSKAIQFHSSVSRITATTTPVVDGSTGTRDLQEEQLEKAHLQQLKKAKKEAYRQKVGKKEEENEEMVKQVKEDVTHLKSGQLKKIHGALRKVDLSFGGAQGCWDKLRSMTITNFVDGGPMDMIMGTIVISNAIVMFVQSQWLGAVASASVGIGDDPLSSWGNAGETFEDIETVYIVIYLVELVVRISVQRLGWAWNAETGIQYTNLLDAGICLISAITMFLLNSSDVNLSVAKAMRLLRLTRTLRVVRVMTLFRPLRVLASTFIASIGALFWSMVLLMILKFIGGLLLSQSLHSFILDETQVFEHRAWINQYYGSGWRAVYSMFELTHSGGWPTYARPVVEYVSTWYAAFFMGYVTLVIFAIIRIITAIFLKETLATAAGDAALAVQEKVRSKEQYVSRLEEIFLEADSDGNGVITKAEMDSACSNAVVLHYLSILEIEVHEVEPLFDLLDDGDGEVTIKEFCQGIVRLKGQARSLDVISIMHDANMIMTQCREMKRSLALLEQTLGVASGMKDTRRDQLRALDDTTLHSHLMNNNGET